MRKCPKPKGSIRKGGYAQVSEAQGQYSERRVCASVRSSLLSRANDLCRLSALSGRRAERSQEMKREGSYENEEKVTRGIEAPQIHRDSEN
jgi:hypothetical protein